MVKVFPRWLKILLIIIGVVLVAGAVILLVENNEPKLDNMPIESTEILAQNIQTIVKFEC